MTAPKADGELAALLWGPNALPRAPKPPDAVPDPNGAAPERQLTPEDIATNASHRAAWEHALERWAEQYPHPRPEA